MPEIIRVRDLRQLSGDALIGRTPEIIGSETMWLVTSKEHRPDD